MKTALSLIAALSLVAGSSSAGTFYFGADLSFANEMQDCGAVLRVGGKPQDEFEIFKGAGFNLVRVRLWNDPDWTRYGNLADVEKTIRRAKAQGMTVLLDFHYADTWADGDKQPIPKAWLPVKDDPKALSKALYDFTYATLGTLAKDGLMPDMVQVGNETNPPMLGGKKGEPIDWTRNAMLLNAAIRAVRDAGAAARASPQVMIHIAQPENVEPWFHDAVAAGVTDFDVIGVSYYPKWSKETLAGLGATINRLRRRYGADVMVVETAYPWTFDYADSLPNVLGSQESLLPQYPATPDGQRRFLEDITQTVIANDGDGVVYWAPDWVSTNCKTPWGVGSSWENATFFDFHHGDELLPGASFAKAAYVQPVEVTFRFHPASGRASGDLYLWGDFIGAKDMIVHLKPDADGAWTYTTRLMPGRKIGFQVYDRLPVGKGLLPVGAGPLVEATVGARDTLIDRSL
jgi:arabinogalactan endo-1,4-beta-galactosidase